MIDEKPQLDTGLPGLPSVPETGFRQAEVDPSEAASPEAPEPPPEPVSTDPQAQAVLAMKAYLSPSGKRSWPLPTPYAGDVNDPTVDEGLIAAARQLEGIIEGQVNKPGFTVAGMVLTTDPADLEEAYQLVTRQKQAWDESGLMKRGMLPSMDAMGLPSKDDSAQTVSVTEFVLDPDATATLQTGDPDTSQQIAKQDPHVLPGTASKVELLDEIIERVLSGEEPPFGKTEPTVPRDQIRRWRL